MNWRKVFAWEEGPVSQEEEYYPSEALLNRFANTWLSEFIDKFQVDCNYSIISMGKRGIGVRFELHQVVKTSRNQARVLFDCLNSTQAATVAQAIEKIDSDCLLVTSTNGQPYYHIIVDISSFGSYLPIGEFARILNKTEEDIQNLFQDEERVGI
jgi:hypothetical protein